MNTSATESQHYESLIDTSVQASSLVSAFTEPRKARHAIHRLVDGGVPREDIGLVMPDSAEAWSMIEGAQGRPTRTAALGSAIGGTLAGLGAFALAGPLGVFATGPFVAVLGGAAAGAGVGGILGALLGLGIPRHEAVLRADDVKIGGALITCSVPEDDHREQARRHEMLKRCEPRALFAVAAV